MSEWFKDWFGSKEYLDAYHHRNELEARTLIKLIISETEIPKSASVLDAACGSGRHSIEFAKLGFNVTGFDLSTTLLNIAKEKSEIENLNIIFLNGDFRTITFNNKFDLLANLFTSFGYFDNDKENFRFIRYAPKILNTNGFFVFDYFNAEFLRKNIVSDSEKEVNGKLIKEKRNMDESRVVKTITISDSNMVKEFKESVAVYTPGRIIDEFSKAGFLLKKSFGTYEGSQFNEVNSPRFIGIFQLK